MSVATFRTYIYFLFFEFFFMKLDAEPWGKLRYIGNLLYSLDNNVPYQLVTR